MKPLMPMDSKLDFQETFQDGLNMDININMDTRAINETIGNIGELCPLCKSDCPSKLYLNFPLEFKSPPTENVNRQPSPATPLSNITRIRSRTPQTKRKISEIFANHGSPPLVAPK